MERCRRARRDECIKGERRRERTEEGRKRGNRKERREGVSVHVLMFREEGAGVSLHACAAVGDEVYGAALGPESEV